MRAWSIEIYLLNENGEEVPATVFDKVTYKLHPSFEKRATQGTLTSGLFNTQPKTSARFSVQRRLGKQEQLANVAVGAVFRKPPFRCQEEGWGEFDMEIVFSTVNSGGQHSVQHDLHFQSDVYDARHPLVRSFPSAVWRGLEG